MSDIQKSYQYPLLLPNGLPYVGISDKYGRQGLFPARLETPILTLRQRVGISTLGEILPDWLLNLVPVEKEVVEARSAVRKQLDGILTELGITQSIGRVYHSVPCGTYLNVKAVSPQEADMKITELKKKLGLCLGPFNKPLAVRIGPMYPEP